MTSLGQQPLTLLSVLGLMLFATGPVSRAQSDTDDAAPQAARGSTDTVLTPTAHPPVPRDLSQLWLAPLRSAASASTGRSALAAAVRAHEAGEYSKALATVTGAAIQEGALAAYASYYAANAQLRLGRAAEARRMFQLLEQQNPVGYLGEASVLGEAAAAEALGDYRGAVMVYERLLQTTPSALDDTLLRLGRAAKAAGDLTKAGEAFARVYFEFALSSAAPAAGTELALLRTLGPATRGTQRFKLELGRAERLFGAKQYAAARTAFEDLRSAAAGDDREVIDLRIAEADYLLKRPRNTRDAVRPFTQRGSRRGEALFFYAIASRDLGEDGEYLRAVRRIVEEFPQQTWAAEALNHLATYYILQDQDEEADDTFRQLYARYPRGSYAERAAWKAGWRAYRNGTYSDTVQFFERAASDFPRSDYRPSWLYWAGRAREQLNDKATAEERYALVIADYLNSYYGRLASKRLGNRAAAAVRAVALPPADSEEGAPTLASLPPNEQVVRALLAAELYDDALNELRFAQRKWGDSPAIQATMAWIQQQQARSATGSRRFELLRGAINRMRRAYPQFMAAGGEALPREVLSVIFPIAYWDLIRKHAAANGLDPYLVAALVAQESTFVADIRSPANAYGLMQLLPSTARQYARKLKITYSTRLLTDPEANVRMGTAYLADRIKDFGSLHLVLASYNAGEGAVRRWQSERYGIADDEFVDDIPYPETQTYVKRILGTAEDYRRLYGGSTRVDGIDTTVPPAAPAVAAPAKRPAAKAPARKAPSSKAPAAPKKQPSTRKRR